MQSKSLLLTLLVAVLVCEGLSLKPTRKARKLLRKPKPAAEIGNVAESDVSENLIDSGEAEGKSAEVESAEAPVVPAFLENACTNKHCGAGRICQISEQGLAECACVSECPQEHEARRRVCSNHNETWASDCQVYQMRCWCDHASPQCTNQDYKHLHINYYGACKDMPECQESEMLDFPRRMRDWLFNIMRDMAEREELTPHYFEMEKEAESNMTRRWTNAAIWKWCDLDGHPRDRSVSRHELFPIRAPLVALEHCIAPFLNRCDVDDDHKITLKEWGKCLELQEDDLEERCEEIREEEARG